MDTNIIYGYFKSWVEAGLANRQFKIPLFFQYLEAKSDKIEPITSFFTLVEVSDNLKRELFLKNEEVLIALRFFRKKYRIRVKETVILKGDLLKWFLSGIRIKDAIQLNIAKNLGLVFLSRDRRLVRAAKYFYKNAIGMDELGNFVS